MNTIKLLKSIIMLVELLPYSSTSKEDILEQLNRWLDFEEKHNQYIPENRTIFFISGKTKTKITFQVVEDSIVLIGDDKVDR